MTGLAGRRHCAALRSKGPVSRERLSPQQWARLELDKGPLVHGFAGDQRWTLGRIKTLIGKLFHVGYMVEGTWKLMRRHGWSCHVPVRHEPSVRVLKAISEALNLSAETTPRAGRGAGVSRS